MRLVAEETGVRELITKSMSSLPTTAPTAAPFIWTATADSILEKLGRIGLIISQ